MIHRTGVEDIEPDHWVAWSFERIGSTGRGRVQPEAVDDLKRKLGLSDVAVVEVFRAYPSAQDPDYLVNAFFEDDRRPLTAQDVDNGLETLNRSRRALLVVVSGIQDALLARTIEGERFVNINGILKHIAVAEWWYCDRLAGVADWSALPDSALEALSVSRLNTERFLPRLVDSAQIVTLAGETWSPRKLLRRVVWHEADHTAHIQQRLAQISPR